MYLPVARSARAHSMNCPNAAAFGGGAHMKGRTSGEPSTAKRAAASDGCSSRSVSRSPGKSGSPSRQSTEAVGVPPHNGVTPPVGIAPHHGVTPIDRVGVAPHDGVTPIDVSPDDVRGPGRFATVAPDHRVTVVEGLRPHPRVARDGRGR